MKYFKKHITFSAFLFIFGVFLFFVSYVQAQTTFFPFSEDFNHIDSNLDIQNPNYCLESGSLQIPQETSNINSFDAPEIGETYIQTLYIPETNSVVRNTWEYQPGLSMYEISSEINLDLYRINEISTKGWILKESTLTKNISISKESSNYNTHTVQENYKLDYRYIKNEQDKWQVFLEIEKDEDEYNSIILDSRLQDDINKITDIDTLMNMVIFASDKDLHDALIQQINSLEFEENYLKTAKNVYNLLYSENLEAMATAAYVLGETKEKYAVKPLSMALMGSEDINLKQLIIKSLGKIEDKSVVKPIIRYGLKTGNWQVATTAKNTLIQLGDIAVGPLIEALEDGNFVVKMTLKGIGAPAIEPLKKALTYGDSNIRQAAADILGELKVESAVELLRKSLKDEETPDVREKAAYALGEIASPKATEDLIDILNDENYEVRIAGINALGKIGSDKAIEGIKKAFDDDNSLVRRSIVGTLRDIGDERGLDILVKASVDNNVKVRRKAVSALGYISGRQAVNALIEALNDEDKWVRQRSAHALGVIGSSYAVESLVKALKDEDSHVREQVIFALGEIGGDKILPVLSEMLPSQPLWVKEEIVYVLGTIDSIESVNILNSLLENDTEDKRIKMASIHALGEIANTEAIKILINTLGCKNRDIKKEAKNILLEIENLPFELLKESLENENDKIKEEIISVIGTIEHPQLTEVLIEFSAYENPDVAKEAIEALGNTGDSTSVPVLIGILNHKNPVLRKKAAESLGKLQDDLSISPLIEALSDDDGWVRSASRSALTNIGIPAVGKLKDALYNENRYVKLGATRILGDLKAQDAIEDLIYLLADKDAEVREEAVYSLIQIGNPTIDLLINELDNENENIRNSASKILENIGGSTYPALFQALENPNDLISETAASILIKAGEPAIKYVMQELDCELQEEFSYRHVIRQLANLLDHQNLLTRKKASLILGKIGAPSTEILLEKVKNPESKEYAIKSLVLTGKFSFFPVVEKLLENTDPELQNAALLIISGMAKKCCDESLDSSMNIKELQYAQEKELEDIALNNSCSINRALALYYIGKNFDDENFLENYIFESIQEGLRVKDSKNITELEMAAILNSGIPATAGWWNELKNREEKINYLQLLLKGDFTDKRLYSDVSNRIWICAQFATQFLMNFNGIDREHFASEENFKNYGGGYTIAPVEAGYGIPVYYATSSNILIGHAFNAVYIGNGKIDDNPDNWILIEPMDDDFSPNILFSETKIYLDMLVLPDGYYGGTYHGEDLITIATENYKYGSDH